MKHDNDLYFSFTEVVSISGCEQQWLIHLIDENAISIEGDPKDAQFNGDHLTRIRKAIRIHRDFDASASATALIMDLLDELDTLRKQVRHYP